MIQEFSGRIRAKSSLISSSYQNFLNNLKSLHLHPIISKATRKISDHVPYSDRIFTFNSLFLLNNRTTAQKNKKKEKNYNSESENQNDF